jgi:hypothetical protein
MLFLQFHFFGQNWPQIRQIQIILGINSLHVSLHCLP